MKNGALIRIPQVSSSQGKRDSRKVDGRMPRFHYERRVWLPNSIGLNPLDYSEWSILEEKAHDNVESFKRVLKKVWKEISVETLEKS